MGLDPQKIENKIQIKIFKKKYFWRNISLSSLVWGRGPSQVLESGSGSGLKPRPLVRTEDVDVDEVKVGKVDNVADVDVNANA